MNKLRYAVYMRKSTEEAERQVLSLSSQEDQIRAKYGDLNIVAWFKESKSAFEPYKRIHFNEMMKQIDEGKIDGIIAWHPDRLSRNEIDASSITWRVRQLVIKDLKFASGFMFDQTAESMMMLQMTMSQSQYYSAKLSKDVKRGNEKKRQMGGLTGLAPTGYINKRTSTAGRGEAIVIKDPERFDLVKRAFNLFLTGDYSLQTIHRIMNDEWGYKTIKRPKSGGTPIAKASIYKMFRNVRYAGLVPDPFDDEKLYKADYPAMITPEEYDCVQQLLGRNGSPRLVSRKYFDLRGFIRCAKCGCMITAERKHKKLKDGTTATYDYYHCTGKRGCKQRSVYVRENILQDQLNDLLDTYELAPEMYDWAMGAFRDFAKREAVDRNKVQQMQQRSINSVQTQLDKLLDMATRGLIDDEQYRIKGAELKDGLKRLHDDKSTTNYRVKSWFETATETFEKLTLVGKKFNEGDISGKKDILLAIGQNPTMLDGKLDITPYEWLIPVAETAKTVRDALVKVRTEPQQTQKASEEAISLLWCGRREYLKI